jgi:histidinol dehydrogenase
VSDCEAVETKGAVALAEMNGKFDQMLQSIDTVKEKQDEMADDISKIKEAVYNAVATVYKSII